MNEKMKGYSATIVATLIIGFSFMFVKLALVSGNPIDILAHRFTFALLAILPLAIANSKKFFFNKEEFLTMLPIVILYPVIYFALQIFSLQFITSSEAGIVQSLLPIFILFLANVFLKERITKQKAVFTILSVVGVLFIFISSGVNINLEHSVGLVLVTLSVVASSLYNIFIRKYRGKVTVPKTTFMVMLSGFVVFSIISVIQHLINPGLGNYFKPFLDLNYIFSILFLGLISSLGTSYLSNYAYSKIEASKVSVFANFVIVVSIFAGVVFLKEPISILKIIGAAITLIGIIGTNLETNKTKNLTKSPILVK